jgi:hypothetical protein
LFFPRVTWRDGEGGEVKRPVLAAAAAVLCGVAVSSPVEPQWEAISGEETSVVLLDVSANLKRDGSRVSGWLLRLEGAAYKDFLSRFAAIDHIAVDSMAYSSVVKRLNVDKLQVNEAVKQIHGTRADSFEVDCQKDLIRVDGGGLQHVAAGSHGYQIETAACSRAAHAGERPVTSR